MNCFSNDVCGGAQDLGRFLDHPSPSPSSTSSTESGNGDKENDYVCMDGVVDNTSQDIKSETSTLDVQLDLGEMALDLKKVTSFRYVILY